MRIGLLSLIWRLIHWWRRSRNMQQIQYQKCNDKEIRSTTKPIIYWRAERKSQERKLHKSFWDKPAK